MKITVRARGLATEPETSWRLLEQLQGQSDLAHLKRDSVLLLALLEEGLEVKRDEGGLYQELREHDPKSLNQVNELEAGHREVIERVLAILATCDVLLEGMRSVWGELHRVRNTYLRTGRAEERLLQDAYSCDLGGEGE